MSPFHLPGFAAQQSLAPPHDVPSPWAEGYRNVPQDADCGSEGIRHADQHVNPVKPSFRVVPTAPEPIPSISVIEHLEQVYFNEGLGVSLRSLTTLANANEPAFYAAASIGEKASIRFELPQFPGNSIQVRVRHGDKKGSEGRPITLCEMGDRQ
ncbi:hypothetical protein V8D89_002620 [Ganoderma adspersum]